MVSVVRCLIGIINQSWCDCWSPWKTPSAHFWKIARTSTFFSFISVHSPVPIHFSFLTSSFFLAFFHPTNQFPPFHLFPRLGLGLNLPISLSFPGQRGESGAGSPAFEWPDGGRPGAQAAARSVSRDLCPGHGQYAATAELPGSHERFPPWGPVRDFLPPGGSWGRPRARTEPSPPSQQFHSATLHALQTPGTQRRPFPTEPRKDTYAHLLPGSARGTHPRSHWSKPWDLYLSHGTSIWTKRSECSKDCQSANHKNRVWTRSGCIYTITYIQTDMEISLFFSTDTYNCEMLTFLACTYLYIMRDSSEVKVYFEYSWFFWSWV